MLGALRFIPPILAPSWRFFRRVEASPRIEWSLAGGAPPEWRELRPRPARLTAVAMLARLFWNPRWNETLFLVSLAERMRERPSDHSAAELRARVSRAVAQAALAPPGADIQLRLTFIDGGARREVVHQSQPFTVGA